MRSIDDVGGEGVEGGWDRYVPLCFNESIFIHSRSHWPSLWFSDGLLHLSQPNLWDGVALTIVASVCC